MPEVQAATTAPRSHPRSGVDPQEYRCPQCAGALAHDAHALSCDRCARRFPIEGGIVDFRIGSEDYYFNPVPSDAMAEIIRDMSAQTWAQSVRRFLLALPRYNPDWLDNLVADGRYAWKFLLDLGPDKRVLDLGCGLGNLTRAVAPHVGKVYALDLTLRRLEFTRERAAIFNSGDDIAFVAGGDGPHLPFPDASLDCVILSGVLEWVGEGDTSSFRSGSRLRRLANMLEAQFGESNPRAIQLRFLREIRRVLKPDGQLFVGIENRLNYEYFTGRPDHHSHLKYGSLLPRFIATLYSIVRNRQPYRTYTYSLPGYRRLLRDAGFTRHEFWGLTRGYSHLEEIIPADVDLAELSPPRPSSWRERIRRHRLFVPAYGIVAGSGGHSPGRLQDGVLDDLRGRLDEALGPGPTMLKRFVVTPKDKLLVFAEHAGRPLLLKLPCNEEALAAEATNADMIAAVGALRLDGISTPQPLARGRHGTVDYFAESVVPGIPVNDHLSREPDARLLDGVSRMLSALAPRDSQHTRVAPLAGDVFRSEVQVPLAVVSRELPSGLRDELDDYFRDALHDARMLIGLAHGDFGVNNVLVVDGVASGLIDWEAGRLSGICILDALSYLVSMHHLEHPEHRLDQSVPTLAARRFGDPAKERFLAERYSHCGVSEALHAPLVHLAWLHMAAQLLRCGLAYDPAALERLVSGVAREIVRS